MSEELSQLLELRTTLIPAMYLAWCTGIVLGYVLYRRSSTKTRAATAVTMAVLGAMVVGTAIFHFWWAKVLAAATTPTDLNWLSAHDGGAIIPMELH